MMRHISGIYILLLAPVLAFAQGSDATITVTDTPFRAFKGIGTNLEHNINGGMRSNAQKVWGEDGVKFRGVRMWLEQRGNSYSFYGPTVRSATEQGVTEVFGTGLRATDSNIGPHTTKLANIAKQFRQNGVQFDGLDVCNKPNTTESGCGRISPGKLVEAIKMLRSKLNAEGLSEVEVIGPSTVEWWPRLPKHDGKYDYRKGDTLRYFDAIENDPEALDAISAFSSQTYGTGVTDEMYAYARRNDKDYYQMLGATDPIRAREGDDEGLPAVVAAQFLSDVNHGVNLWMYWIHIFFGGGPEGLRPRVQQLKALAHTFDVGAHFYRAESDVNADMHFNYGSHDEVIGAVARNPDDSWGIGLVNLSGISSQHYSTTYGSGQVKTVTINMPRLANAGTIDFSVKRTVRDVPREDGTIHMQNGRLTITIPPKELVTLRSPAGIGEGSRGTTGGTTGLTGGATGGSAGATQQTCDLLTPNSQIPQGFAAPYNVLSASREMLVSVSCTSSGVTLSVGSGNNLQYIYRIAYIWRGNQWQQINLTGGTLRGDAWYVGSAQGLLPHTATELSQNNFVIAYVCTRTPSTSSRQAGQWKCGCRDSVCAQGLWQLQIFRQ